MHETDDELRAAATDYGWVHDDYDLAVVLAGGLRDAHAAGDVQRVRELAVTLEQHVHVLGVAAGVKESLAPSPTHLNGRPDPRLIAALLES